MVNYTLQTNGLSNTSIHIFPAIANSSLASAVRADMQFSLNGSSWKPVSNTAYYYTFNEMKSADSIYVFFSSNFFKQMVNLGISDINTKDLFNFRFLSTTSPESGWYEFSTSNTLIINPVISASVLSPMNILRHRRGRICRQRRVGTRFRLYIVTAAVKQLPTKC